MAALLHQALGSILVVVGIILTPTPVPFGLILLTLGLTMLAPYMPPIQALIRSIRRKWPKVDASLRRHRDRMPDVVQKTIDKTHPDLTPAE